jgi:hypothetical protein
MFKEIVLEDVNTIAQQRRCSFDLDNAPVGGKFRLPVKSFGSRWNHPRFPPRFHITIVCHWRWSEFEAVKWTLQITGQITVRLFLGRSNRISDIWWQKMMVSDIQMGVLFWRDCRLFFGGSFMDKRRIEALALWARVVVFCSVMNGRCHPPVFIFLLNSR